jgi:hypothetical protein
MLGSGFALLLLELLCRVQDALSCTLSKPSAGAGVDSIRRGVVGWVAAFFFRGSASSWRLSASSGRGGRAAVGRFDASRLLGTGVGDRIGHILREESVSALDQRVSEEMLPGRTGAKGGIGSRAPSFVLRGKGVHREGATLDFGLLRARSAVVAHHGEAHVVALRRVESTAGGGGSQMVLGTSSPLEGSRAGALRNVDIVPRLSFSWYRT